jgi:hypothetical protein
MTYIATHLFRQIFGFGQRRLFFLLRFLTVVWSVEKVLQHKGNHMQTEGKKSADKNGPRWSRASRKSNEKPAVARRKINPIVGREIVTSFAAAADRLAHAITLQNGLHCVTTGACNSPHIQRTTIGVDVDTEIRHLDHWQLPSGLLSK